MTLRRSLPGDGIPVHMGEARVVAPPDLLEIHGLGSCIALALHDPEASLGGLAHTVIPRPLGRPLPAPAWASSVAVRHLVGLMERRGASLRRLEAHIAGGASMFPGITREFNVGDANAREVEAALASLGIPLRTRQVGGTTSRSVRFDPATGVLDVTAKGREDRARKAAPPERRPRVDSEREMANILLHRAVAPLSRLLEIPITLETPDLYELSLEELEDFLGGPNARLFWAFVPLERRAGAGLVLTLPEAHAFRLIDAVRSASGADGTDDDLFQEVATVVAGHFATALARLAKAPLIPGVPVAKWGRVAAALDQAASLVGPSGLVVALHARVHAAEVLPGADLALVLPDPLPALE